MDEDEARALIRRLALDNAAKHGSAQARGLMGYLMKTAPELRSRSAEVLAWAEEISAEINGMDDTTRSRALEDLGGAVRSTRRKGGGIGDLPSVREGEVVLRFAPGPSGPLHLGHSRAVILNDEYARRHRGKFILRLEDTNPSNVYADAYDQIREDMDWLEAEVHQEVIQSSRLHLYHDIARDLARRGGAYVFTGVADVFREAKDRKEAPAGRDDSPEDVLEKLEQMIGGDLKDGEAIFVVKTEIDHKNPALRDWPALRINTAEHPLTGHDHSCWPLMNFSVACDDHLLGMTHVVNGKDHETNSRRQGYLFDWMDWTPPIYKQYGLINLDQMGVELKTSHIREQIGAGEFSGWSDHRLGTLTALRRRGFEAATLRTYWKEVGAKKADIQLSLGKFEEINRSRIESRANRVFFSWDPVAVRLVGEHPSMTADPPLHPDHPERGVRKIEVGQGKVQFWLSADDVDSRAAGDRIRLSHLCNLDLVEKNEEGWSARFSGLEPEPGVAVLHWNLDGHCLPCRVHRPVRDEDGSPRGWKTWEGYVEESARDAGKQVQFERFGFVVLEEEDPGFTAYYTHS